MNVNLNKREEFLLKKIMQPLQNVCEPNSPVYYEMALKLIQNQLFGKGTLITTKGRQMLLSICEKIAFAQMDTEIENILAEAQEIKLENKDVQIESTKVQSFKKVTNFSERHQQIIEVLSRCPEGLSRNDISERTNIRLCSCTARVKELLDQNLIRVCGTKYDEKTDRVVQVLEMV